MTRNPPVWPVLLSQNSAKIRKSTDRGHKLISSESGKDTSACTISSHFPHAFSGKCPETQIWPVSLSQNSAKIEKSIDHGHKLISFEDIQATSACKISGHSLHAFSGKSPETSPDGRTDRRTDGRTCRKTVTVGRVDQRSKEGISGFGRTDGRTDNPKT